MDETTSESPTYGPQDWELLAGIGRPDADFRVWRHRACGECLEFPDDDHRCRDEDDRSWELAQDLSNTPF
jgi:hypothetical protein